MVSTRSMSRGLKRRSDVVKALCWALMELADRRVAVCSMDPVVLEGRESRDMSMETSQFSVNMFSGSIISAKKRSSV